MKSAIIYDLLNLARNPGIQLREAEVCQVDARIKTRRVACLASPGGATPD